MSEKLTPFGECALEYEYGYSLPFLVVQMEGLGCAEKDSSGNSIHGLKVKRLDMVGSALEILKSVLEMEDAK